MQMEWDFVETPSRMLENVRVPEISSFILNELTNLMQWTFEAEVLDKISGHFQDTSKKIPKDVVLNLHKVSL